MRKNSLLRIAIGVLVAFVCVGTVSAKVTKILAIGNSFSQDAIEQNLHEIAAADGIETIVGNMYIGGCSIERHVNNSRGDVADYYYRKVGTDGIRRETKKFTLEKALADEEWDYVSVQQASGLSGQYETYKLLPELISFIKKRVGKNTKIMFHQTWAYSRNSSHSAFKNYGNDQMRMYEAIMDASKKAVKDNKITILIPSGTAIQNARSSFIGDNMNRDGYHLELTYGRYTAACAWYETIFKRSIIGNSYSPKGVNADIKSVAQQAAHAAVARPYEVTDLSGVKPSTVLYKDSTVNIGIRIDDLVGRMTLDEKIMQLNQYTLGRNDNANNIGETVKNIPAEIGSLIYFGEDPELRNAMQKRAMESRLGIPVLFGYDLIHGFRTIFPIPLAQACSWNPQLVRLASEQSAREAKAAGIDWTFSPMIDVSRDPRWGRIAESYGEDPYVNGVFGAAAVRGYQGRNGLTKNGVAACLKHYVGYGASEAGRDYVYTEISRQTLWDTYLPPYKACLDAGALTVMSSFNNISGTPGSANKYTLTDILCGKWHFRGFVVSDWGAVKQLQNQGMAKDLKEASMFAFNAGLDMDMMSHGYDRHMKNLVAEGKVDSAAIDASVKAILLVKFKLGLFEHPYTPMTTEKERFFQPEAMRLDSLLAAESMVLLKNDGSLLPLKNVKNIAVIGPLAKSADDLLGCWAGHGKAEDVKMLHDGIEREFAGKSKIMYAKGCEIEGDDESNFNEALTIAKKSDVIILCLGEKRWWSGENTSRTSISLPDIQKSLLRQLHATGKPIVLVLSNGRPLQLNDVEPYANAILEIWHPGINGADAFAGILSGKINPSGRLCVTFPYNLGQVPIYYGRRKSGRRGSQGVYKDTTSEPLYRFGDGLSYSTFSMGEVAASSTNVKRGQRVKLTVEVANNSDIDGQETVFWYVADPYSTLTRPEKELRHFEKKLVKAHSSETFTFNLVTNRDLSFVDSDGNKVLEDGDFIIYANDKNIKIELIK